MCVMYVLNVPFRPFCSQTLSANNTRHSLPLLRTYITQYNKVLCAYPT